jgi:hypothetical protein
VVVVVELDPPQATAKIPVRNTLDTRMSVQKASDDLNLTVTIYLLRSGFYSSGQTKKSGGGMQITATGPSLPFG